LALGILLQRHHLWSHRAFNCRNILSPTTPPWQTPRLERNFTKRRLHRNLHHVWLFRLSHHWLDMGWKHIRLELRTSHRYAHYGLCGSRALRSLRGFCRKRRYLRSPPLPDDEFPNSSLRLHNRRYAATRSQRPLLPADLRPLLPECG